jgi:hypothetical protein
MSQIGSWTACVWSWFCYIVWTEIARPARPKSVEHLVPKHGQQIFPISGLWYVPESTYVNARISIRSEFVDSKDAHGSMTHFWLLTTWKYIMGTMGCLKYMHSYWAKVPVYSIFPKMGWREWFLDAYVFFAGTMFSQHLLFDIECIIDPGCQDGELT